MIGMTMNSPSSNVDSGLHLKIEHVLALVAVVWAIVFFIRLSAPSDLMDNDQEKPSAYTLDILENGQWLCQREMNHSITSKPPVFAWWAALSSLAFERINRFSLCWPNAMSLLLVSWALAAVGAKRYGLWAGLAAALVFLVSPTGFKMILLVRSDTVFAAATIAAAACAYLAAVHGRSWLWFWIAAALSTLTKGPLGLLLALGGLLALFWRKRPVRWRGFASGLLLYFILCLGWFALAYLAEGEALTRKMIFRELVYHTTTSHSGSSIGEGWYKHLLYFTLRFLPWSLIAWFAFWKTWRRPALDESTGLFEGYWLSYFFFGIVVFSLAPHQRADHLFPLLPVAALFVGRELGAWLERKSGQGALIAVSVFLALSLGLSAVYYHFIDIRDIHEKGRIVQTAARHIESMSAMNEPMPIVFTNGPIALQYHLNIMRLESSEDHLTALMKSQYPAYWLAYKTDEALVDSVMGESRSQVVSSWTYEGEPLLRLLSNARYDESGQRFAYVHNDILLEMDGFSIDWTTEQGIGLKPQRIDASYAAINLLDATQTAVVEVSGVRTIQHQLGPHESRSYAVRLDGLPGDWLLSAARKVAGLMAWAIQLAVLGLAFQTCRNRF